MTCKVGIDLGTTNSAAAFVDFDGRPEIITNSEGENTTPSVVAFDERSWGIRPSPRRRSTPSAQC